MDLGGSRLPSSWLGHYTLPLCLSQKDWLPSQFFLWKTRWQKLSVDKSLSSLQSHVPLNSSICQSEEGLNLFSPEPFWLFISCLHDDAYLSTMVIKEQIKKLVKQPNVCPRHKANRSNKAQNGLGSFLNSKLLFKESLPKRDNKYLRKLHRICRISNGCLST